jgi:hypothetical protein
LDADHPKKGVKIPRRFTNNLFHQVASCWLPLFAAVTLIAMLIAGKTFNPLRGLRPMIVNRDDHPGRYWTGIALWAAFLGFSAWITFASVT